MDKIPEIKDSDSIKTNKISKVSSKKKRVYMKTKTMLDDVMSCFRENTLLQLENNKITKKEIVEEVKIICNNAVVEIANLVLNKNIEKIEVEDPVLIEAINLEKHVNNGNKKEYERNFISSNLLANKRISPTVIPQEMKETKNTRSTAKKTSKEPENKSLEMFNKFLELINNINN